MPDNDAIAGPWEDHHSEILTRGIVSLVLQHRPDLYTLEGLETVNNNRGDRINKKLQQILKHLTNPIPGGENIIKEEVAKGARTKKSPKKESTVSGGSSSGTPSPSKKRKAVKKDVESDEE